MAGGLAGLLATVRESIIRAATKRGATEYLRRHISSGVDVWNVGAHGQVVLQRVPSA